MTSLVLPSNRSHPVITQLFANIDVITIAQSEKQVETVRNHTIHSNICPLDSSRYCCEEIFSIALMVVPPLHHSSCIRDGLRLVMSSSDTSQSIPTGLCVHVEKSQRKCAPDANVYTQV